MPPAASRSTSSGAIVHARPPIRTSRRPWPPPDLVVLTATAHDKDGDSASAPLNIGTQLIFKDDGPSITGDRSSARRRRRSTRRNLAADDSDSFAAQFTPVYGADGAGGGAGHLCAVDAGRQQRPGRYRDRRMRCSCSSSRQWSAARARTRPTPRRRRGVRGQRRCRRQCHARPAAGGRPPDRRSGRSRRPWPTADLVVLTATAHDKDGDSASAPLNIGTQLIFKDDGPSITGTIGRRAVADGRRDATWQRNDSDSFAAQFTPVYGADGPGERSPVSYALSTPGGHSGLVDTATGECGDPVPRVRQDGRPRGHGRADAATGDVVFEVSVDAVGSVTLDQQRAVVHPTADPDEVEDPRLGGPGGADRAPAHDKDGDSASDAAQHRPAAHIRGRRTDGELGAERYGRGDRR